MVKTSGMSTDPSAPPFYAEGARSLQDHFDSRRLADRLEQLTLHSSLTDDDIALIGAQSSVWIGTAGADGWPDVSYKGGAVGFVSITSPTQVRIPNYDGNGMYRTFGNVIDHPQVSLLFVDMSRPWRLRVQGYGRISTEAEDLAPFHEANAVLIVDVVRAFPNCGRYIHVDGEISEYVPRPGIDTPAPSWKSLAPIAEVLPASDPMAARATGGTRPREYPTA